MIMKFRIPAGVGKARDNEHEARMCYALVIKQNECLEIIHMVETS